MHSINKVSDKINDLIQDNDKLAIIYKNKYIYVKHILTDKGGFVLDDGDENSEHMLASRFIYSLSWMQSKGNTNFTFRYNGKLLKIASIKLDPANKIIFMNLV